MKKLTEKELKREYESPRGQLKFLPMALALGGAGTAVFATILFDPFGLLEGTPAVHEAKKWIALCLCFIWIPAVSGIWFMVILPLRVGAVTRGSWTASGRSWPHLVLRSEEPARFRFHIFFNCVLLAALFAFGAVALRSFIRDLEKAKAAMPNPRSALDAGIALYLHPRHPMPGASESVRCCSLHGRPR